MESQKHHQDTISRLEIELKVACDVTESLEFGKIYGFCHRQL